MLISDLVMRRHAVGARAAFVVAFVLASIAASPAGAQDAAVPMPKSPTPELINGIIDSTRTDNPPRFCWENQIRDEDGNWADAGEHAIDLDSFRHGRLDFGPDFTETNIMLDWPYEGYHRLHRVPCPEPVGMRAAGGNEGYTYMHGIGGELYEARLDSMVRDPETRSHLLKVLDAQCHHSNGGADFLGGVSIGVGVGAEDHGHDEDHRRGPDGPAPTPGD
jgi:hypothetical protein